MLPGSICNHGGSYKNDRNQDNYSKIFWRYYLQASAVRPMGIRQVASSINLLGMHPPKQLHDQADVFIAKLLLCYRACLLHHTRSAGNKAKDTLAGDK